MSGSRTQLVRAASRVVRALPADTLRVIASQQPVRSDARDANMRALERGAAAVVTGQQVGLFLGPLYTIYKAASAIALARVLARDSGVPVVPVFWLQTEDHDLPEIAWAGLPGERVSVGVDAKNRQSIAQLALPAEVDDAIARVAAVIGDGPNGHAHVERLRRHYRAGARWASAFAGVLCELFDELVVIDPREPTLAAHASPVHRRAIRDAAALSDALIVRTRELGDAAPVHVRAGSPLSFVHPDGPSGPRVRVDPASGDRYSDGQRRYTEAQLLAMLDADPLRFSTSALLRPIVQDTLLPTVAYVGGPAEVAYAAQAAPLYRAYGIAQPAVLRRASFTIVDVRMRALLDRYGFAASDAARSETELLARARAPALSADDVVQRLFAPFAAAHAELAASLRGLDKPLARTHASVERAIRRFAGKVERAALHDDAELVAAVRRMRATLAPDGAPQERVLSLSAVAARDGDRAFVERVLDAVDPFDPSRKELA